MMRSNLVYPAFKSVRWMLIDFLVCLTFRRLSDFTDYFVPWCLQSRSVTTSQGSIVKPTGVA